MYFQSQLLVMIFVFFVIILFDAGEGNRQNIAEFCSKLIGTFHKYCVVRFCAGAERFVGVAVTNEDICIFAEVQNQIFVGFTNTGQVAAGNDNGRAVNNADSAVDGVSHLVYDTLKQSV